MYDAVQPRLVTEFTYRHSPHKDKALIYMALEQPEGKVRVRVRVRVTVTVRVRVRVRVRVTVTVTLRVRVGVRGRASVARPGFAQRACRPGSVSAG